MAIGTLTAAMIAELAFKKALETGAGEVAKKYSGEALKLIDTLYQKIRDRLMNNPDAEPVVTAIEAGQSTDIEPVVPYLQAVMADDPDFADEIRQLAQQINNIDGIEGRNVQNVFGGQGQQFNTENVNEGATVQQGTITNNTYYGAPPKD
ncbi:MAG: hypothetical protein ACFBSF_09920 [Leptolyngbyaceae cyanobacterium]